MSAPQKPSSSRWGSFLSQAVAGVEARLDNILAEDDPQRATRDTRDTTTPAPAAATTISAAATPPPQSSAPSKSANDRLQERLARAVASRNNAAAASTRPSAEIPSATSSPRPSSDAPRATHPVATTSPRPSLSIDDTPITAVPAITPAVLRQPPSEPVPANGQAVPMASLLTLSEVETLQSEVAPPELPGPEPLLADGVAPELYQHRIAELESSLETVRAQHQDELHSHAERVDALQAKLQYLAKEAAQNAKSAASNAPGGSLEKKVADKDDQVAQLMLEGQKLAATEQKHRAIIKKLRAQLTDNEKLLTDQRIWRQQVEAETASLRRRAEESSELEKASDKIQIRLGQLRKESHALKAENEAKEQSINNLKCQLQDESERAKSLASKANDNALEAGQRRIKDLEDTVVALEIEKGLIADRAKIQIAESQKKAVGAADRARAVELELKGEVQMLESKLESLRTKAEEASSGAVGDTHAKLLRQIETLQTQYSIASDNWQGMEASLGARIANVEKERDEALRRESDMRKKARETANRVKRQEEELEEMRTQLPSLQRDLASYQLQLGQLRNRAEQAETALGKAQADLAKAQAPCKEQKNDEGDSDRRNWLDEVVATPFRNQARPDSPFTAPTRTFSGDNFLGLQNYPTRLRKTSAPSSNGEPSPSERPSSSARRPSAQPPTRSPMFPTMQNFPSATAPSVGSGLEHLASPLAPTTYRDDATEGLERSASPQNVLQDITSVSTMTAGPSVQLVERMSSAIRRLESEKVAAREELARISSQRDDARGEIVALMRASESAKAATKRIEELEKEAVEINERYQTTLEMLGEKSELVEELKADVQDVKAMYRDLVERTL
ncbi:hypothetical protein F5Y18DRAFT_65187 [Xylariaceae sp. FL1019]|nr:hypothetical protein F5Y18DRAFT_65187 [Xylariaceae sp. FL1019]